MSFISLEIACHKGFLLVYFMGVSSSYPCSSVQHNFKCLSNTDEQNMLFMLNICLLFCLLHIFLVVLCSLMNLRAEIFVKILYRILQFEKICEI